ncbi:ATP-binding cassette domain-containing protein [Chitinophaga sp. NPDC101104]|uniref:ATP-binding cassette domain-containing protein n=1 Tax=Chitinophaga sp. NPDC101104 TaxID=3390561 RepID=UPI003D02D7F7
MQIELSAVVPVPLRDRIRQRPSDIWDREVAFQPGQFVKIKAPSGTGKTTLVHYLYNIRYDYTGIIKAGGKPWADYSAAQLAAIRQDNISVVFQDLRLFDQLTAEENIELKRVMNNKPLYPAEKIREFAEQLGVTHVLGQSAATLSYGERQRIAIIRALMQPFQWLMMDEPFSHLDEGNTAKAAKLIDQECRARNAGFILTDLDHDQHFNYDVTYQL